MRKHPFTEGYQNYAYISFQRFVLGQSGSADKRKILAERKFDMIDGEHVVG
jgi:hypothetical protein